ncbi:hypothetical protein SLEP1_g33959 [Rubroshorea leprosula]|uniref:Pentatricopeptide repeat-containing protein n=1 Tax=Rubroshorea leprosula TaxID=152421 RepID=A0AAV5KI98_9ROSI|nr:hypothetical protein SLEP1_g33959 [Rubroshorea leprosula]
MYLAPSMAVRSLKPIFIPKTPTPKPKFFSFSSSASPPLSNQPELVSTVTSILTHHRSKSRWNTLLSLYPSGFTPSQFSQIVLQIKSNAHLAFRFFLFTKQKSICNHNFASYSTIIHVLSRARLKTRARNLIKDAILAPGSDFHGTEFKHLKLFESLVKTYNDCGSAPFVFDLLVKSCLEMKKIDASIEIVKLLRSRGISPQVSTCNALIWGVSRCRGVNEGYEVFREVFGVDDGEKGRNVKRVAKVKPNVNTFNALMVCFYGEGLMEKVEEIWNEMETLGCVANAYSYSVLMQVFCDEGKVREAEKLWKEMRVKKLEPDIVAYNTMIGGLCKIGLVMRAEEFYREMGLRGIETTCATYGHLISGYCKVADVDSAIMVYKDMCRKGYRPGAATVEVLVGRLCDIRRVLEALEIMRVAVGKHDVCPTEKSYEFLIKGLCEEERMEEALKLQAEMVAKGFKPNMKIYGAFIDGYLRQGNDEMIAMLRREMLETQNGQEED